MLVSLTVGKVDAGVTVLLTPDKRLIEFPSILLPPNITSGSIVDINVGRNVEKEAAAEDEFRALQDRIFGAFGASEPAAPVLSCRNATQTSVVLEWDPIGLATADLISLSLYRNGQKAGNIPRPLEMHSTKISGLAVDTEYSFYLMLRTSAGTRASDKVVVRTHKMTDLSGITITAGVLPAGVRDGLARAVERIGAKMVDGVRIDTTHFVTMEGRGAAWEKAVENNIPVVRPEWVSACEQSGRILGVTKFYLDAMRPPLPLDEVQQYHQQQQQQQQQQRHMPASPAPRDAAAAAAAQGPAQSGDRADEAVAARSKRKSVNFEADPKANAAGEVQSPRAEQPQGPKVRFSEAPEEQILTLQPKPDSASELETLPEEDEKEKEKEKEKQKGEEDKADRAAEKGHQGEREEEEEEEKEEEEEEGEEEDERQASHSERASFQEVEL
ncbi:Cell fusion protein cfr1 [Escovopsis weberi]|uniref:Cell fusion protein cfr1 n=1 Tax=Escovopsis weberi TaxID=150374 RepID=A0A0M8MTK1_ESCWE|nr:Cell fusion protein cfr1 [Escovopsis weberi]